MQSTSKLSSMVHASEKNCEHVQWSLFQAMPYEDPKLT
jgi:hypothetical protein